MSQPAKLHYEVINTIFKYEDELWKVTFMRYGRCFQINFPPKTTIFRGQAYTRQAVGSYNAQLSKAMLDDRSDSVEAMLADVVRPCSQILWTKAPWSASDKITLKGFYEPNLHHIHLEPDESGDWTSYYQKGVAPSRLDLTPKLQLPESVRALNVPNIHPRRVIASWETEFGSEHPTKVFVDQTRQAYFKSARKGSPRSWEREIQTYDQLKKTGLTEQLNVPSLEWLVRADQNGPIMGALLTHVKHKARLSEMTTLNSPRQSRYKWADQVKLMVSMLHKHGIVWGDANANNVLIDRDDDVWLVDFGGHRKSRSEESVQQGSFESDQLGVAVIFSVLELDD